MVTLEIILAAALALVLIGAAVVIVVLQSRSAADRAALVRRYEDEKDALQDQIAAIKEEKAAVETRLQANEEYQQKISEIQAEQHRKDLEQMKAEFENLSNKNSESFKMRSAETISALLQPMQDRLKEFSESVKNSQEASLERHSKLEQKIEDLDRQSRSVGDEARNLANALTGYSKVQGDFGEMLLTDILKNAGLTEGIHFVTQGVITDASGREVKSENGRTMIPDVMVNYPDDTAVIVDSKVSLSAYNEYMNAAKVEDRVRLAKAHVESVRKHVDELKTKDYTSYLPEGKRKIGYNIMFVPVEGAFRLMLEEDPRLWQVAKDNNVLIVSQMTLVIVLNMIQMSWKQHEQEQNISAVYSTVSELMSQLQNWLGSMDDLGAAIVSAGKKYDEAKKTLKDSNQSVIKKIKKLEALGAEPKRSKAKIKSGARMITGPSSIVPKSLDLDPEEE